jgi:hypothetical protein
MAGRGGVARAGGHVACCGEECCGWGGEETDESGEKDDGELGREVWHRG